MKEKILSKICQSCGVEYFRNKKQTYYWFQKSKYCNNKCYYKDPVYQKKRAISISNARKGWKFSAETLQKISEANKGKKRTEEEKKRNSESNKGRKPWNYGIPNFEKRGVNHPNWKGGVCSESHKIRNSTEYKEWRKKVFERDNYTCCNCNIRGGFLHADHIKPFCKFIDLRFELENGRTLCVKCHYKIGWNPYKDLESLSHAVK